MDKLTTTQEFVENRLRENSLSDSLINSLFKTGMDNHRFISITYFSVITPLILHTHILKFQSPS